MKEEKVVIFFFQHENLTKMTGKVNQQIYVNIKQYNNISRKHQFKFNQIELKNIPLIYHGTYIKYNLHDELKRRILFKRNTG